MARRKTTEQFIAEAKAVHGNKCDYSRTEYIGANDPVTVICPTHGPFVIPKACRHVDNRKPRNRDKPKIGQGCPDCLVRGKTTAEFIAEARAEHGDKYDYSETTYTYALEKIDVICPKHGRFSQLANSHVQGMGCDTCAHEQLATKKKQKAAAEFVKKSRVVHGDKYDYSKVVYETGGRRLSRR